MLFTLAENHTGCDSHLSTNNNYAIKQLLLNAISLKVNKILSYKHICLFLIID
jgi:hypothetical protein